MHFKYIVETNRPKAKRQVLFYDFSLAYKELKEAQNELESGSQMILFCFCDQIVHLLSKYNKLTFKCQQ